MEELIYSEPREHAEFVLSGLDDFRRNHKKFCDFSISVDGNIFSCHRSILSLFSSFFKAAIEGDFKESKDNTLCIRDIPTSDVQSILEYVYTGTLSLNHSNVEGLLMAATRLGFQKVVNICVDYIRHQIDQTNCLDILKLAKNHCHNVLEASARQYLNDHLCSIFEYEDLESEIGMKEVVELLEDSRTHKHGEEAVILTILTWLQTDMERRKPHAEDLLHLVRWESLPAPFLLKVLLRHPLLKCNQAIKVMVLDHIRHSYDDKRTSFYSTSFQPSKDSGERSQSAITEKFTEAVQEDAVINSSLSSSYRIGPPSVIPQQVLLLIGGLNLGEAERGDTTQPNVMCYHPVKKEWISRCPWPERGLRGFSVSKLNHNVIVTGGCSTTVNRHIVIKRAWKYQVATNEWFSLPDMTKARSFHCSCELNGHLYVVGGAARCRLDVEFYDQHKSTWTSLKKIAPRMMYNFTASGCNSKLILIGCGQYSTIFLQCYNPAVDSWTVMRSPNVPRHLSAPVCATTIDESKIFVSGDNTKKMYIFDPNNNTWSRAADMNNLHSNGNLIFLDGNVFHTGGHWEEDGYWDEMESYDIAKNTWTSKGALPHLWLFHGCAGVFLNG